MDNKKINGHELNTPKDDEVGENTPMTADDLIKRLKSNLKQNPKLQGEDIFESDVTEEEKKEEFEEPLTDESESVSEESFEETDEPEIEDIKKVLTLEEAAEFVQPEKNEKKASITDSIKSIIAAMRAEEEGEAKGLTAEENVDAKASEEPVIEGVEEACVAEKEYSVVIENSSDKTNVFNPSEIKKGRKNKNTEKLFEDNEAPAVAEAEQLTFSMTEGDLQKSIEEAEAFIFDREHIDNPEEVINDVSNVPKENVLGAPETENAEYDQTDLWIASAFGDEDELKEKFGEEEAQKIETQLDIDVQEYLKSEKKDVKTVKIAEEYIDPSQKKEIFSAYRQEHKLGLVKLIGCFIVLVIALIFENIAGFGGALPGALNQQNYPVVYILASLQLLVIAGAIAWEEIYKGVKALLAMRPLPESITAVVAIISAVYHIAHCFISETDPKVALYVFPAILCIFVTLVCDFFNLRREIYSFNVVASKRIKYTITTVANDNAVLENEAFGEYLSEEDDVSMFRIGKTGFVKGFYERMNSYSKSNSIITILLSISIALGLVFFIVSTVVHDVKSAFSFGYLAFLISIPCCALLAFSLPFYRASKKAFDDDSAIIGNISLDEYSRANTLSFDDKDVFPSYGVKVKSIKVYGDSRIDKILYNSASVFKLIGGPLADVFDTATHELGNSENVEIIEIAKDGIEALIDGQHVYIGKASYLKNNGYTPMSEPDDDGLETSGEASIMYMVCDDFVSAKMYVQYTIDPDFEFALRRLYKAGICIGIKTFDPNVDDKLLGSKVKITKYPVRILRCKTLEEASVPQDEADSGIVSKSSPRSLLNAFVLCSKVLYANRTNVTVKILSVAFSVLLMAFLLVLGKVTAIPSVYVVLYQLFWMVPVYLISKIYV